MTDQITDGMVEAGYQVMAYSETGSGRQLVREILEAALAGRTVVELPEPDEVLADATVWHVGPGAAVTVSVEVEDPTTVGFSDGHGNGLQLSGTVSREFFAAGLAACDVVARRITQ